MKSKAKRTNDLGQDKVGGLLLRLALPAITAQVINMLYNIVDRIYIGHLPEIGATALTGVGVAFPIIILITAFSSLIGMGGAPQAAIRMGKKDDAGAEKILGNCFSMLIILSIALTAVFLIFGRPLLEAFGASKETLPYADSYLNIYVCGTVFVMMALGLNSFITTQGFATTSMLTVVIGAVINIILDPIFMFVFHMGVQGAALATILSQGVSCAWVLWFLCGKKTKLRIKKENLKLTKLIWPVLALGVSPFIMQSTESLLSICLNTSLQTYGGDIAVGSMTILTSVMQFLMLPLMGLSQGAQPIISYNYGAGNRERVGRAFKLLLICSLVFSGTLWLLCMLVPGVFVRLFTPEPALIEAASWALRIYFAGGIVMGAQIACQQTFVAVGQSVCSLILALLRKIILLIPLIYILPAVLQDQVFAVFLAEPVADVLAATATVLLFTFQFKRIWKGKEALAGQETASV